MLGMRNSPWLVVEAALAVPPVRQQWQPVRCWQTKRADQKQQVTVHTGVCTGLAVVLHRPGNRHRRRVLRGDSTRTAALLRLMQARMSWLARE